MTGEIKILNRQRFKPVNAAALKRVIAHLLEEILHEQSYDLTIHLLTSKNMAALNQKALRHEGPTDVITFDYTGESPEKLLAGELFICVEVAVEQSATFHTRWEVELVRYAVHGILHLQGHDDLEREPRRRMKAAENRLMKRLAGEFNLRKLTFKTKVAK